MLNAECCRLNACCKRRRSGLQEKALRGLKEKALRGLKEKALLEALLFPGGGHKR